MSPTLPLRSRPAAPFRAAALSLLAVAWVAGARTEALAQGPILQMGTPGGVPVAGGDPFAAAAGGAYAVPVSGPVAVAQNLPPASAPMPANVGVAPAPAAGPAMTAMAPGTEYMASGPIPGAMPHEAFMPGDPYAMAQLYGGTMTAASPVYMAPQVVSPGTTLGAPIGAPMGAPIGSPGCNCGPGGSAIPGGAMMQGGTFVGDPMMGGVGGPVYTDPGFGAGGPIFTDPGCGTACPPVCPPIDGGCGLGGCGPGGCGLGCGLLNVCGLFCNDFGPVCAGGGGDPCGPQPGGLYYGAGGRPRSGWAVGYSFVFLKPYYGTGDAVTLTPAVGAASGEGNDFSLETGSRIFVERVFRNDMGVRVTAFGLDADSDPATLTSAAGETVALPFAGVVGTGVAGETAEATSDLELDTLDIDITQRLAVRKALVNFGGGLRLAEFDNDFAGTLDAVAPGDDFDVTASRHFRGIGPTLFGEVRRPIGGSRLSLLASARGSMLYGDAEEDVTIITTPGGGGPPVATTAARSSDEFVAIGETQLGAEFSTWITPRTVFFVQAAYEAQYWLGVGSAVDRNDDLGLHGFNTTLGFEW